MRLAITIAGIALLTAAIWETIDDRLVAAGVLAVAALAFAFIRNRL
jgi:hypothetical protein